MQNYPQWKESNSFEKKIVYLLHKHKQWVMKNLDFRKRLTSIHAFQKTILYLLTLALLATTFFVL